MSETDPFRKLSHKSSEEPLGSSAKRLIRMLDLGGIFLILMSLAIAIFLFWRVGRLVDSLHQIDHTDQVVSSLHTLQEELLNLETGVRGYSLTGNAAFLAPYQLGRQKIGSDFRSLQGLVAQSPAQIARSRAIYSLYRRWSVLAQRTIALRRLNRLAQVIQLQGVGKGLMDQMRRNVLQMIQAEEALWPQRRSFSIWMTRRLLGSLLASALAIGILAAYYSRRHARALFQAYEERSRAMEDRDRLTLFLESVLNQMPSGVIIARSEDGKVLFGNRQVREILGQQNRILHQYGEYRQYHYCHPDGTPFDDWEYPLARALNGEEVIRLEATVCRADGKMTDIEISAVPIRDADHRIIAAVALITDIQERKRIQTELQRHLARERESLAALKEERKLRDRFIQMLTHDLRTPLTSATMIAELLESGRITGDGIQPLLERQRLGLSRMDRMIQDLLDGTRIQAGGKLPLSQEICELNSLVQEALSELGHSYGQRFVLRSETASLKGFWDPNLIRRIVENLCSNAAKYGAPGHLISVKLADTEDEAILQVHNEGKPIPADEQADIFRPYKRAESAQKSRTRGWGLGLAFVKAAVEAHEGTIALESCAEAGTTFTIRLPKRAEKRQAA